MKISYHNYQLFSQTKPRSGALLRVELQDGAIGYSDCHPWEEWGDQPLTEQLNLLKEQRTTPLTRRSMAFAWMDAAARSTGKNLLEGMTIPESHYLVPDLATWHSGDTEKAIEEGFSTFKIKLGKKLAAEIPILTEILKMKVKVRLDFNQGLTGTSLDQLLKSVETWKNQIEFLEDPFPFDQVVWRQYQKKQGISLACDQESVKALGNQEAAGVVVLKPAFQFEELFFNRLNVEQKMVVTSYLDHPLGQVSAAYVAAKCLLKLPKQVDLCGLLSHRVYKENEYSKLLNWHGPVFKEVEGTGFGFNDLLENTPWKELKT